MIPREQTQLHKQALAREMLLRVEDGSPPRANGVLADARARFLEIGAPIRRDEYWKYTDPAGCTQAEPAAVTSPVDAFAGVAAPCVRLEGGRVQIEGSLPEGVEAGSLAEALSEPGSWTGALFGVLEKAGQNPVPRPLAALNTALFDEGIALRVTAQTDGPVRLLHKTEPRAGTAYGRVLVKVEPGASLTLLETDLSLAARNALIEVEVGAGGRFDYVRAQAGEGLVEVASSFVRLQEGAEYRGFTLAAGGDLIRNETVLTLAGPGGRGHLAGGVLGRGGAVIDNTILVVHEAEGCESRQVFKVILDDRARGVFQGKVLVRKEAQKTDGYQIARAVLLDGRTEFDSKPELEIYADDVKCSHGSTAGELDEGALFYLRSRGVGRAEAEMLLVAAFLEEAVEEIESPEVAEIIRSLGAEWMARHQRGA